MVKRSNEISVLLTTRPRGHGSTIYLCDKQACLTYIRCIVQFLWYMNLYLHVSSEFYTFSQLFWLLILCLIWTEAFKAGFLMTCLKQVELMYIFFNQIILEYCSSHILILTYFINNPSLAFFGMFVQLKLCWP